MPKKPLYHHDKRDHSIGCGFLVVSVVITTETPKYTTEWDFLDFLPRDLLSC